MTEKEKIEKLNSELRDKAIDEDFALFNVMKDLLTTTKQQLNRVCIVLIISILCNLIIVGSFLWYESQWEYTTTETTTTQGVDGENSNINNIEENQYNDKATHNENIQPN